MISNSETISAFQRLAARLSMNYTQLMEVLDDLDHEEVIALHSALSNQLYTAVDELIKEGIRQQ